jgi:ABC-type iron transport system FetAB permease component
MKKKKETKIEEVNNSVATSAQESVQISTKAELCVFVTDVRDKLLKDDAAPIFAMAAMNQVMSLDSIYELLDKEIKEILQEIWVKLSQSGFHLRKPPLLFGDAEGAVNVP